MDLVIKGRADYFCMFRAEPEKRILKTGIAPVAFHRISDFSWWSIKLLQPYVHEMESPGSCFKINLRSRVTPNMSKSRERRGPSKALSHKRTYILITGFWDLWPVTMHPVGTLKWTCGILGCVCGMCKLHAWFAVWQVEMFHTSHARTRFVLSTMTINRWLVNHDVGLAHNRTNTANSCLIHSSQHQSSFPTHLSTSLTCFQSHLPKEWN